MGQLRKLPYKQASTDLTEGRCPLMRIYSKTIRRKQIRLVEHRDKYGHDRITRTFRWRHIWYGKKTVPFSENQAVIFER